MSGRYQEFAPPPELARHVACLWIFEGEPDAAEQRIVPDGRCELILNWGQPYLEQAPDGTFSPQPRLLFAGQLTRPLVLRARGPAGVIGVRFESAGARAWLHRPLSPLTDRRVGLADLKGEAVAQTLTRRLADARHDAARLALAASHVWGEVGRRPDLADPAVETAVTALRRSAGRVGLDELTRRTGLAPRALQRRFAAAVGVSPRTLAAVIRFRRVFEALEEASIETWTEAAQAAGYFDHPQMARDFRRFVGCPPSVFLAGRGELAASLVAL